MADSSTRPGSYISTIYGGFVRRMGGWISIADLITLMAELGVDAQAVRSAISRLKKNGTLEQERRDVVGYRLSAEMLPIFDEGDRRIFNTLEPAHLEDGWIVAVFSIPESERARRHQLRARLSWLGFGTTAPGVWIAPARVIDDAKLTLRRMGLTEYVHLFTADYAAFSDLRTAVSAWWDFPAIEQQYAAFTQGWQQTAHHFHASREITPAEAFRSYVPMLTQWRRLPYLDPGLPLELLPEDWNAVPARRLFLSLHDLLSEPAFRHIQTVTDQKASKT